MTNPKPIVVEIDARDLRGLITTVLPFACNAKQFDLPVLQCVHIQGHGSCITATATNRYVLGMQRADAKASERLSANLPVKAARELLALFKPQRSLPPIMLRLKFTETHLTVDPPEALPELPSVTWALNDGKYPAVQAVIDGLDERPGDYAPMVDPRWLRVLSALPGPLFLIPTAQNKRVVVRNDQGFIGAVMPIRDTQDADARDLTEWAGIIGAAKEQVAS